jgi:1,2-diacylglycerol 3-alpha-glucosyltransferase
MQNNKQKLLLVTDTYHPRVDGTIRFIDEFIKRSKEDYNITLLAPKFGKGKKSKEVETTLLETSKYIVPLPTYPSIQISRKNLKTIKTLVKQNEIIFCQGPALASFLAIFYSWRYKKRCFFYPHVISWELFDNSVQTRIGKIVSYFVKKFTVFLYNQCNALFLPYIELKSHLEDLGVKVPMKIAKLGVDIKQFSPITNKDYYKKKVNLNPKSIIISYVGRISKEKNLIVLKEAIDKLNQEFDNIHLLIVGDGAQSEKEIFKNLRNVTITGFIQNVSDYLKASDIFVMPSLTETTSLSTLEAMSCQLPVITTKVGFMANYITRNQNGMFFPKNSPTVLAMKIKKLLQNDKFKNKLAKNARKTIAYSFSWERSINKVKRLIKNSH